MQVVQLPANAKYFDYFNSGNLFEVVAKGRYGGILVDNTKCVPLVRTTTAYQNPPTVFPSVVKRLKSCILKHSSAGNADFNNAMIEKYTSSYRTMRYHTDQAQDLKVNSRICLFSCYNNRHQYDVRQLHVQSKQTGETVEVLNLPHNSFVMFDTNTNARHRHKIQLYSTGKPLKDCEWIGVTFRMSRTFIDSYYPKPTVLSVELRFAYTDAEKSLMRKWKGEENKEVNYQFPPCDFTLGPGDLLYPKLFNKQVSLEYKDLTIEECREMLRQNAFSFQKLPQHRKQHCAFEAVSINGLVLQHVRKKKRTLELCKAAFKQNQEAMKYCRFSEGQMTSRQT